MASHMDMTSFILLRVTLAEETILFERGSQTPNGHSLVKDSEAWCIQKSTLIYSGGEHDWTFFRVVDDEAQDLGWIRLVMGHSGWVG